jgi:hypothetical protein
MQHLFQFFMRAQRIAGKGVFLSGRLRNVVMVVKSTDSHAVQAQLAFAQYSSFNNRL